ncbi:MAG TPA: DUF2272 domain-containing protein [Acetobacteraceae bacterium]|nr:DUF2272 domain-containing protein [Acetobacteraceae bacterium]
MPAAAGALVLMVAGCAQTPKPQAHVQAQAGGPTDMQLPPFARVPYEPISRQAVVAIALREWRLFGEPVDDDPPGSRPPPLPDQKPERVEGLWQRVGEYWWLGLNAGSLESAWTGKHDAQGQVFPASDDWEYAWSAAFISYVMRIAGAGAGFPYSEAHSTYINLAKQQKLGQVSGYLFTAERPTDYAPRPGDLICLSRARKPITYDDLPDAHFPAHCDIVVATAPGQISVIGGNVDDAVTMKHVPVTPDGKLAGPDGAILDTRYPWLVVLRGNYPGDPQPAAPATS